MELTYTTAKSGSSKKEARVLFDPPLAEYGEVKARLLQMKVEAENALGMVRLSSPRTPSPSDVSLKGKDPNHYRLPLPIRRARNRNPRRRACLHDLRTKPRLAILQRGVPPRRAHPRCLAMGANKHLGSLARGPLGRMRLHVFALQEAQDPARPNCAYLSLPFPSVNVLTSIYRQCIY